MAKLVLCGVRDSADTFTPLKSVTGGLCFILENCEVVLILHLLSAILIHIPANQDEQASNRIIGPLSQSAC